MIRTRKRRAVEAEGKWLVGEIVGEVRGWRVRILWKERWTSKGGEKKVEHREMGGGRWRRASAETCEQNVM